MEFKSISEKFGIYFAEVGLSKTYGRLFGYLMTANQPVSMGELVANLQISKSTASTEVRRLLATGIIEKILIPNKRSDFYRLKNNIWKANLDQKIKDIRKLRDIIKEVPSNIIKDANQLNELADYCEFMETEFNVLTKKYEFFLEEKKRGYPADE